MPGTPNGFLPALRETIEDPYELYRWYRDNDPTHRIPGTPDGRREDEWVLFRYDDVAAALSSRGFGRRAAVPYRGPGPAPRLIPPDYPNLARLVENWLVFMDPPRHTELRALVEDRFAARLRSGELPASIRSTVDTLLSGTAGRGEIELVGEIAAPLPLLVILDILGVPAEQRGWLRQATLDLQDGSSFRGGDRAQRLARAERAAADLDAYFRERVQQRRGTRHRDLIGELTNADGPEDLRTDDVLVGTCVHLLTSGHEATANAVSKGVLTLLRHPVVLRRLVDDPDLVAGAVEELIRYDAPVQMVTRWAYQDADIGGSRIGQGDKLTLVLGSANRDPARFPTPDTIDLDRGDRRHCGFSMGIHYCLGSPLARLEARIALRALLDLLPDLRLEVAPQYSDDVVFHGPRRLVLRVDRALSGSR